MERDSEKERDSEGKIVQGGDREKREGEKEKKTQRNIARG